jgi:effector-binding domain-containing protein
MMEMTLVDAVPRRTAVVRGRVRPRDLPAFFARAFDAVTTAVSEQGVHVTGPPLAVYRLLAADEFDVEAGFPVAAEIAADGAVLPSELPGGRTVETVHVGPYETLGDTYRQVQDWVRQHGLRAAPLMWESYLTDPEDPAHRHDDGPRTLVVQPVEDATRSAATRISSPSSRVPPNAWRSTR